jgi:hypothetical protein
MNKVGRRAWGFLAIVIAMLLLYGPTPAKYHWVNLAMAALALFWFIMFLIEDLGRARREQRRLGGGSR